MTVCYCCNKGQQTCYNNRQGSAVQLCYIYHCDLVVRQTQVCHTGLLHILIFWQAFQVDHVVFSFVGSHDTLSRQYWYIICPKLDPLLYNYTLCHQQKYRYVHHTQCYMYLFMGSSVLLPLKLEMTIIISKSNGKLCCGPLFKICIGLRIISNIGASLI